MNTESVYNAAYYSDLPSMTPFSYLLKGKDERADVETVWQTAHMMDALLNVADPSVLSNGEVGRLLRGEQTISPPLVDDRSYEDRLNIVGAAVDGAIDRSGIARDAAKRRWDIVKVQKQLEAITRAQASVARIQDPEPRENFIRKFITRVEDTYGNFVESVKNFSFFRRRYPQVVI